MIGWKVKAAVMKACDLLPCGARIYKHIQKTFGRLDGNPMSRIPVQIELATWLQNSGRRVEGMRVLEVGTGHVPIVPIGFFLSGAEEVITVDLHRRLDWHLMVDTLQWISLNQERLHSLYEGLVPGQQLDERLRLVSRYKSDPGEFCKRARITYLAPSDATRLSLLGQSIDLHLSVTVLEHIPRNVLAGVMKEAKRVLANDGVALHAIDLSDHFQHTDNSITRINFLRYSERKWQAIAGNQFAYCNRLRASDYLSLFREQEWEVEDMLTAVDEESIRAVSSGLELDRSFARYAVDDLCTTRLWVRMRQRPAQGSR